MPESDVDFGATEDVFAEIESDPLAEEDLPAGVEEGELAGDNPSEDPEGVLEEPEESEDPEPEPVQAEMEVEPEAEAEATPEPEPEPEPEKPVAEESQPEPEPEPEPKPGKSRRKRKGKGKAKKAGTRAPTRGYMVLYEIEGGWAEGHVVEARSPGKALEDAFATLVEKTGQEEFSRVVAVPVTNWKPEGPLRGEQEVRSRVTIG